MSNELLVKQCTMLTLLTDLASRRGACSELKADSCLKHRVGRTPCMWNPASQCKRSPIRCQALVANQSSADINRSQELFGSVLKDANASAEARAACQMVEFPRTNLNKLLDADRCLYRYSELASAWSACLVNDACVGVVRDAGLLCGRSPTHPSGKQLSYELRGGRPIKLDVGTRVMGTTYTCQQRLPDALADRASGRPRGSHAEKPKSFKESKARTDHPPSARQGQLSVHERTMVVQNATAWCSNNDLHGVRSSGYACRVRGSCTNLFDLQQNEPFFNLLIGELLLSRSLPLGGIADAGAHTGENACFYASLMPDRTVTAVEPHLDNVAAIRNRTRRLGNVNVVQGGLGASNSTVFVRKEDLGTGLPGSMAGPQLEFGANTMDHTEVGSRTNSSENSVTSFQVHMLDHLYRSQRLGFAHFDVEGQEANVLQGATQVIMRDRPVFTTELHVHYSYTSTTALMGLISRLGYRSYLVEGESCGVRADCRNLLNIPKEWTSLPRVLERHLMDVSRPTRNSTTAYRKGVPFTTREVILVNETNIFAQAHPCCRPRGMCCPDGPVPLQHAWNATNRGYSCCVTHTMVRPYYARLERAANRLSAQNLPAVRHNLFKHVPTSGLTPHAAQPRMGQAHHRIDPTEGIDVPAAKAAIKQLVDAGFTSGSEQLAWLSRQVSQQVRLRNAVSAALKAIAASGISPGEVNQEDFLSQLVQGVKRGRQRENA
jgi:FkbM family methyltransferase